VPVSIWYPITALATGFLLGGLLYTQHLFRKDLARLKERVWSLDAGTMGFRNKLESQDLAGRLDTLYGRVNRLIETEARNERRVVRLENNVTEAIQGLVRITEDLGQAAKEVRTAPIPERPTSFERIIHNKDE
jgi:hypothetical protein